MESELCGSWCGSMAHVLEAHRCSISVVFPWVMSMPHPAGLLSVAVVHSRIWKVYDTVCRHACWNCVVSIDGRPGSGPTFLLPSTVSGHLVLRPCMTVGWEQESCDLSFPAMTAGHPSASVISLHVAPCHQPDITVSGAGTGPD